MTAPQQTGPQPATAHECARAWSALTAAHARVAGQLSTALQRACGLTITDFEILLRLDVGHGTATGPAPGTGTATGSGAGAHPGQRIGDLTGAVRLSQPALSRAVTRLAGRGFLTRSGTPDDARCVLITLTPAGRDILAAAAGVHAGVINETLLDRLTPAEQDVLARVLARVADG
jgi:DNA-binding MarR family transcriptional regulator